MADIEERSFIGIGWQFPVQTNEKGQIATATGDEAIRQSIHTILNTAPGERVMLPEFGCRLQELVFGVADATLAGRAETAVREALTRWERRIELLAVKAAPDPQEAGRLLVEIEYRIESMNSRFNLVYPFYLEGRR